MQNVLQNMLGQVVEKRPFILNGGIQYIIESNWQIKVCQTVKNITDMLMLGTISTTFSSTTSIVWNPIDISRTVGHYSHASQFGFEMLPIWLLIDKTISYLDA